jgi:hypothetical protein
MKCLCAENYKHRTGTNRHTVRQLANCRNLKKGKLRKIKNIRLKFSVTSTDHEFCWTFLETGGFEGMKAPRILFGTSCCYLFLFFVQNEKKIWSDSNLIQQKLKGHTQIKLTLPVEELQKRFAESGTSDVIPTIDTSSQLLTWQSMEIPPNSLCVLQFIPQSLWPLLNGVHRYTFN